MEKAKPIEPGCLARILPTPNDEHPEFVWMDCEVVRRHYDEIEPGAWWEISIIGISLPEQFFVVQVEHGLRRIDDPDIQKEIESEREIEKPRPRRLATQPGRATDAES